MSKIRVLQVGCGGMSAAWLGGGAQMGDVEFVGLCDLFPEAAQKKKDEFGLDCPVFSNTKTALEATRPDAVFDCTIPSAHTPTALLAFEHGAHVLCEKPLSDSLENAQKALAAAQKAEKKYAVTQNYRYARGPRRLREFLDSGALGRITTINTEMYLGAHFGGFRDEMKHVLLLDMSIHTFDMARFLGACDPQWVFCHEWNPPGSWYAHDGSANAIFGMSDEIIFNFRGSWCATGLPTGFQSHWRVIGERGSLSWDGVGEFHCEIEDGDEGFFRPVKSVEVPEKEYGLTENGHLGVMREFLDSIQGSPDAETSAFDNIQSLKMVMGAVESSDSGQKVSLTS